jgi:hypothetical protein
MWTLLLGNWRRMAANRLGSLPLGARIAGALVLVGAMAALVLAGSSLADDLLHGEDPEAGVRQLVFWLNVGHALVFSYTVFEALFRAPEARVLAPLPVEPAGYARYAITRIVGLHLLLLVPSLLVVLPLGPAGRPDLLAYAALVFGLTAAAGVPLALLLHLLAGRSLLGGDTGLKKMLSGGLAPSESAFLFYSPALALAGTMTIAVGVDVALRIWLDVGNAKPLLFAAAIVAAVAAGCVRESARVFRAWYAIILPRFWETEILPPYHEEHLPRHVTGLGSARLLSGLAADIFRKDLIQMRRRHRVDGLVLVAFVVALLVVNLRADGAAPLWAWNALILAAGAATLFNPAFRLLGDDLESAWVLQAFPIPGAAVLRGKMLVIVVQQAPALLLGAVAVAVGPAGPVAALIALGIGGAAGLAIGAASLAVGLGVFPTVRPFAWTVRLAVAGIAAACIAALPPL